MRRVQKGGCASNQSLPTTRKRRCSEAVSLASWPPAPLAPGSLQQALLHPELRWSQNLPPLSPRALHSGHYSHLVGILGSPGSAVEADGHARCCERRPGSSFPLLLSSVEGPPGSSTGHSATQSHLQIRQIENTGPRGWKTELAGDPGRDQVEPSIPGQGSQDCEGHGWVSAEWVPHLSPPDPPFSASACCSTF